jgi:hypothetical protein
VSKNADGPTTRELKRRHAAEHDAWLRAGRPAAARPPTLAARLAATKSAPAPANDAPGLDYDDLPATAVEPRATRWVVVGDVHFGHHSEPHWRAFRAWHADHPADVLLLNGDMLDFAALSRFDKGADDPTGVLDEIKLCVAEVNALAREARRVVWNVGNHEARFSKAVQGANAQALKGVLGLDLHAVLVRHGLDPRVEWCREGIGFRGVEIGDALARHGDRQAGRFSGRFVAATALSKSLGRNVAVSHHHKGQLHAETFEDRTVWGLAVPTMEAEAEYAPGASWVRGFAVVEVAPDGGTTPYLVIQHAKTGRFSYGGRVYG